MVQNDFPRNRSTIEKWHTKLLFRYLNSRTIPIYQWIPPSHPQVYRWCSHIGVSLMFFWTTGSGNYERKNWFGFWSHQGSLYKVSKNPMKSCCLNFFLLKNRSWIFFRHRALFLIRPTIDMSGVYTCKVTNNDVGDDEDDYDSQKIGDDEIDSCVMAFGLYCSISCPCKFHSFLKSFFCNIAWSLFLFCCAH